MQLTRFFKEGELGPNLSTYRLTMFEILKEENWALSAIANFWGMQVWKFQIRKFLLFNPKIANPQISGWAFPQIADRESENIYIQKFPLFIANLPTNRPLVCLAEIFICKEKIKSLRIFGGFKSAKISSPKSQIRK
jgi:hypothetical protein